MLPFALRIADRNPLFRTRSILRALQEGNLVPVLGDVPVHMLHPDKVCMDHLQDVLTLQLFPNTFHLRRYLAWLLQMGIELLDALVETRRFPDIDLLP